MRRSKGVGWLGVRVGGLGGKVPFFENFDFVFGMCSSYDVNLCIFVIEFKYVFFVCLF